MEKTIVISDMHVPYHNKQLLRKVIAYARDAQPTGIVILGDFLDLKCFASYSRGSLKNLRHHTYQAELTMGNAILDEFDSIESIQRKEFLYGNHEDRILRWFAHGDNAIVEGHVELPEEALQLVERGYNVQNNFKRDSVMLGPLRIMHGEYWNKHTAMKHVEVFGDVMYGHTHRLQTFDLLGKTGYNIGFLGDIESMDAFGYAAQGMLRQWRNGFATVHHSDTEYHAEVHKVTNNSFVAGGKVY